jgi:hypothetical protein
MSFETSFARRLAENALLSFRTERSEERNLKKPLYYLSKISRYRSK